MQDGSPMQDCAESGSHRREARLRFGLWRAGVRTRRVLLEGFRIRFHICTSRVPASKCMIHVHERIINEPHWFMQWICANNFFFFKYQSPSAVGMLRTLSGSWQFLNNIGCYCYSGEETTQKCQLKPFIRQSPTELAQQPDSAFRAK